LLEFFIECYESFTNVNNIFIINIFCDYFLLIYIFILLFLSIVSLNLFFSNNWKTLWTNID